MLKGITCHTPVLCSMPAEALLLLSMVDKELHKQICDPKLDELIWRKFSERDTKMYYPAIIGEWCWRKKYLWKVTKQARMTFLEKDLSRLSESLRMTIKPRFREESFEKKAREAHFRRIRFGGCAKGLSCTICHPQKNH
eukprot:Phypoly_transcript_18648.p1 GENE.Phypoly_transcript_18648~~Phypoly_transcript_18648.p1  ORF type:complete len:139 (+),score=10.24 Phypoly_transcript_18648:21-437(+)